MGDSMKDAINILRSMKPMLDPTEDFLAVVAAEEQMVETAKQRQQQADEASDDLKAVLHVLDAARTSSTRPPSVPSEEAHAKILNDLDALRLSLAKSINDAEGILATKEAELAHLREECATLETSDPANEHELDATALKLTFFKGLGFEPVLDKKGRVQKLLVRSQSDEIHCIALDNKTASENLTQSLWKLACT